MGQPTAAHDCDGPEAAAHATAAKKASARGRPSCQLGRLTGAIVSTSRTERRRTTGGARNRPDLHRGSR
eukprot:3133856-Alexandrium_andersonii.AAC.1